MDGTPKLITDVKFTERRRGGYEPDEVNNFLEQIAEKVAKLQDMLRRATAQTDEAEARAVEAQRALSAAESRAAHLEAELAQEREASGQRVVDAENEAESASRVLLMAQRTADATIEDANRTAQQTVAEARSKATHLVIEAEAEAARMRTDAERETQELIAQRQAAVVAEVQHLEEARNDVSRDVDVLQGFLDEQRTRLRSGIDELQKLLDDPAAFRGGARPTISEVTAPPLAKTAPPERDEALEEQRGSDDHDEATSVDDTAGSGDGSSSDEPLAEWTGGSAHDSGEHESDHPLEPAAEVLDDDPSAADEGAFPDVEVPELLRGTASGQQPSEIDLTASELFDTGDRSEPVAAEQRDGGPPTELFAPFAEREADDPLGPPDADADAAMRAFFEANFDESDEAAERQRSRFGFRR